ncbi:MAG: glutaminyl-peptide cyclotransferase [Verrucomicrobiota bacterium]
MKSLHHFFLILVALCAGCRQQGSEQLGYEVVSERPHDSQSYTQGFEFHRGKLLESSGGYGNSNIREVDPATGKILRKRPMATDVFVEGLTVFNGELWCLTWREGIANVLDPDTFRFLRSYEYKGEGWGITHDGKHLIMSNGTATLKFMDSKNFSVVRELEVRDGHRPVEMLNELEFADGVIWANVYGADKIARIDPADGRVTGWLELSGLRSRLAGKDGTPEVLNGIARDPASGRLFVTGKNWPSMFEIEVK